MSAAVGTSLNHAFTGNYVLHVVQGSEDRVCGDWAIHA